LEIALLRRYYKITHAQAIHEVPLWERQVLLDAAYAWEGIAYDDSGETYEGAGGLPETPSFDHEAVPDWLLGLPMN
jgi:hypothetical protein